MLINSSKLILSAGVLIVFSCPLAAKKMVLLDFNKGEMPTDNINCDVSLAEEHADKEGDFALKVDFKGTEGEGSCGEFKPKKASWEGFKKVKYIVFNPTGNVISEFGFSIKGAKMTNEPDNRKDWKVELAPGRNEFTVNLPGNLCNDGKTALDFSRIYIWKFRYYKKTPATIYILKVWLED
jgi:hypothetical protein